ncbi:hypothetical protein PG985_009735 [Apiospora marii]|uniref:uncharacterized protein n=1 Tax=Apiospora marii TaxID=335849 RepID=UPI0031316504
MVDHFSDVAQPHNMREDVFKSNKALANKCIDGLDPGIWSEIAIDEAKQALKAQVQLKHNLKRANDAKIVSILHDSLREMAPMGSFQPAGARSPWHHAEVYVKKAPLGLLKAVQGLMRSGKLPGILSGALKDRGQEDLLVFIQDPVKYKVELGEYHKDWDGTIAEKRPSKIIVKKGMAPGDENNPTLRPDPRPQEERGWEDIKETPEYELLRPLRERLDREQEVSASNEDESSASENEQDESNTDGGSMLDMHDADELNELINEHEEELATRDAKLAAEKDKVADREAKLALLRDQNKVLTRENADLKRQAARNGQAKRLQATIDSLRNEVESGKRRIARRDEHIGWLDQQVALKESRLATLKEILKVLGKEIAALGDQDEDEEDEDE